MKMNGRTLDSQGVCPVCIYGGWTHRTVFSVPGEWRFFIRLDGEFIEVFHDSFGLYSTTKKEEK